MASEAEAEAEATASTEPDTKDVHKTIKEGSATMVYPADQESTVFYNPVQVQNRDLSILMITLYAERRAIRKALLTKKKELRKEGVTKEAELGQLLEQYKTTLDGAKLVKEAQVKKEKEPESADSDGIAILDALAASGLRSMRYWNEIPGVKHVTINDLDEAAVERAKLNLKNNNLQNVGLDSNHRRDRGIAIVHGDATHEMYISRRPQQLRTHKSHHLHQKTMWDVIDLDPYGSAAPFLDGAVQAVESGGLLCITCTDMAALGGSHPETAYGRYASLPIQSAKYLQELAVRILLHTISVSAAKYGRTIKPIMCVGMAFYVRVFVEVNNDKQGVKDLSLNIGNVYQSTKCPSFTVLPHGQMGGKNKNVHQSIRLEPSVCEETGAPFKVGGPLWLGAMHDQEVIAEAMERLESTDPESSPKLGLIATKDRILGLLSSVREELDTPLYYQLPDLCKYLHASSPPLQTIMAAIYNAGYQVSGYHKEPQAIKTNAPNSVVWDVLRSWIKKNPVVKPLDVGSTAAKIMAVEPKIAVDFTITEPFLESRRKAKVARFPLNPTKNWGPKSRGTGYKRKSDGKTDPNPKRPAITDKSV